MTVYNAQPILAQSPWMAGEQMMQVAYFELTAGLANGDTIVIPNMVTPSGVIVTRVRIVYTPLDTNGTPTGTFSFGDNQTDSYAEARFMSAVKMGGTAGVDGLLHAESNVAPSFDTNGAQQNGIGYYYDQNQQASGSNGGFWNGVLTVTAAPATAASTGTIWFFFEYSCAGTM